MDLSQLDSIATRHASATNVANAFTPKSPSNVSAKDDSSSGSDSNSGSSDNTTITSDDFLTLLVSELKNQDPTQPTDPNSYIQQLVGVNSLQQLIQVNQGLTTFESAFEDAASS